MIELQDVSVAVSTPQSEPRTILRNLTLRIGRGDWVFLVGPNGSGKTTFLKVLAGAIPFSGAIVGTDPATPGVLPRMALMFQEPDNQFVASTVENELLLSMRQPAPEKLSDAIDRFSLGDLMSRNPHRLSGGEKQRLALATIWLSNPAVLLLDEPTAYLDSEQRAVCLRFVTELHAGGATIIWTSSEVNGFEAASRVVCLEAGEIVFSDSVGEFRERHAGKRGGSGHREHGAQVVRHERPESPRERTTGDLKAIVTARGMGFSYADVTVFRGATLDVYEGETLGVTGLNGSGKTTLMSLLAGVVEPTTGSVERKFKKAVEGGKQNVFYLFQNPERLFFAETVLEEVSYGLKSLGVPRQKLSHCVSSALEKVELSPDLFLQRSPFTLSIGEMRRLAFAIALALRPRFLLMDEPNVGLDPAGRAILEVVVAGLADDGATVVIASHEKTLLSEIANRVVTVENGRIG